MCVCDILHCIVSFVLVGKCEEKKGRLGDQAKNLASKAVVATWHPLVRPSIIYSCFLFHEVIKSGGDLNPLCIFDPNNGTTNLGKFIISNWTMNFNFKFVPTLASWVA